MSWPLVKLGDVAPAKPSKHAFSTSDDVWTLNLDQVEADTGKVLGKVMASVSEAGTSTHGFDERHVLYSKLRPYLNKVVLPDGRGLATTELVPMLPDPLRLDRKYLAYYLRSKSFVDWVSSQVAGAKMPRVSMQLFWQHEIPLPPLPEQKRVAAILDKADAIRRKRQQAIQLADDFLRAVFLEMFGDVVEGAGNVVKFSDIAVLDAPMVDPRDEKYIDLIHIGPDRIEKKIGKLLPALTARDENLISKKFLFDDRYVLYSKIRPYLRKCAVAEGVGLCSADMYPVRPVEETATKEFLWMLLLSDFFTAYTESLPARANIPKLNRQELEAFTLSLPEYSQQLKFSSIVRATNIASQRVVKSAAHVDGAFESLSQKAFSGQL
ncbi:MAG: restriction endonuclease subunit S [Pseudomonas profundi]|uniref:restriction endonuclease subunit S n=1 Tax=Pseudomonas profundi TaxID=1981513 RepID=UPI003001DDDC